MIDLHARTECRKCGHSRHAHVPYLRGEQCSVCGCQRFTGARFEGVAWWLTWFVPWMIGALVLVTIGMWLLFQILFETGTINR